LGARLESGDGDVDIELKTLREVGKVSVAPVNHLVEGGEVGVDEGDDGGFTFGRGSQC
jgi:hypothetical protein